MPDQKLEWDATRRDDRRGKNRPTRGVDRMCHDERLREREREREREKEGDMGREKEREGEGGRERDVRAVERAHTHASR